MDKRTNALLLAAISVVIVSVVLLNGQQLVQAGGNGPTNKQQVGFTDKFFIEDCTFSDTGSTSFFILEPNYQLVLSGEEKDGTKVKLKITVLDETKEVDGVETRVIEERETADGKLVEVSRNFFAICEETDSVFYFGEKVNVFEDGQVTHPGEWLAGDGDNRAGIIMPGTIMLGARYMQEIAPGVAMDQAEIVSMDEVVDVPARVFEDAVKMKETTPLEPGAVEYKYHAKDVGLIQDGNLKLEKYGFIK
jgi:hypothetical protein